MRRLFLLLAPVLLLLNAIVHAATTAVGFTPAGFKVSETGAATFSIPIQVPPGVAGMEPKLSLTYTSQAGNGPFGAGWSLSGLSAIARCPRTLAQDGVAGAVNYDSNDRYCLDGQRLIAISGTYGANGTEYRTELDSFAKVISYGTAGNGPAWFKVWTKAGQTLEFGNTADSRIEAEGKTTVRVWAINKLQDTTGNNLLFEYIEFPSTGDYYPGTVRYGNRAVGFGLAGRADTDVLYHAGSKLQTLYVVSQINTYVDSNLVKRYNLAYEQSASTNRARLTSVTECAGDAVSCLPSSTFGYTNPTNGYDPTLLVLTGHPLQSTNGSVATYIADFNGDGRLDVLRGNNDPASNAIWYGTETGFTGLQLVLTGHPLQSSDGATRTYIGDFNGDGRADVLRGNSDPASNAIWYGTETGFTGLQLVLTGYPLQSSDGATRTYIGDFNGDGRADVLRGNSDPAANAIWYSTGSGFTAGQLVLTGHPLQSSGGATQSYVADFNGDGKADVLRGNSDPAANAIWYSTGSGFTATQLVLTGHPLQSNAGATRTYIGDFNGDGKADVLRGYSDPAANAIWYSTGSGFTATQLVLTGHPLQSSDGTTQTYIGDFNADGKTDVLRGFSDPASNAIWYSTGADFTATQLILTGHPLQGSNGATQSYIGDFNGDGKADVLRGYIDLSANALWYASLPFPDLLTTITSGLGAVTSITHKPLTHSSVYTKDTTGFYTMSDYQGSLYVVSSTTTSDGIGGNYAMIYAYTGAKINPRGRGFLGFRIVTSTDPLGLSIVRTFRQDWPYVGLVSRVRKTTSGGLELSVADNIFACKDFDANPDTCTPEPGKRFFPYVSMSIESGKDLNGTGMPALTTTYTFDSFGNATLIKVTGAINKTTTNTYTNDTTNWFLGRLTRSTVQSTATRTSSFEYDASSGLLTKEVIEPDTSNLCLVTTYTYDAFANKTGATTRNCNGSAGEAAAPTGDPVIDSRTSTTTYDSQGRFATGSTNALSQSETRAFNTNFGGITSLTGPNNLTTTWSYDGFGRKTLETRADGTKSEWAYAFCNGVNGGTAPCPTHGKYLVTTTPKNSSGGVIGAITKVYFDALNREIRSESQGFSGTAIYKDTQYDANGRVSQVSKPYHSQDTVLWTTFVYDTLGRVTQETQPTTGSGTIRTATTYNGLTIIVTVSNNGAATNMPEGVTQTKTTTKNVQGQTATVTDTQNNTVTYTYDPFGNLLTTNAGGITTTLTYDLRGRKLTMADPDMGNWTYVYDVLGQLKKQTNAKSQITTMTYDKLGRMTQRTEPDLVSKWFFDSYPTGAPEWDAGMTTGLTNNCAKGVGKLCFASSDNGYRRLHTYDSLGRASESVSKIDTTYKIVYGYDSTTGRPSQTTYPTGFITKNVYNARGDLHKVTNSPGTLTYWEALTVSATGKVLTEKLGNGLQTVRGYDALDRMTSNVVEPYGGGTDVQKFTYTYDTIGNLTQRVDVVQSNLTENFTYDRLNRLLQSSGTGLTTRTLTFNTIGNITYKSNIGTYNYNAQGTPCTSGTGGGGPHALCSITGMVNGYANPTFTYDANGNMTAGLGRTLTYTSYNMVATVTAPNNLVPSTSVSYTYMYNAEHERTKHIITRTDGTFTTLYLHPAGKGELLYEKETKPTITEHKHYIVAGSTLVGVYLSRSDSTTETRYFHHDHLGSLSLITNASGAVLERLAYEAYGKRRYPAGTDDTSNALYGITTDRGFTSHEHLDEIALIHMNGRIYDPHLGRFFTADPQLQYPADLQDYNRYSYVHNNPLGYVDPTGYGFWKSFKKVFRIGVAVAALVFAPEIGAFAKSFGLAAFGSAAVGQGIVGGGIIGFVAGGDLRSTVSGAIGGGLFGLAGDLAGAAGFVEGSLGRAVFHGVAGGTMSAAQGGDFATGFLSAGAAQLIGPNLPALGDIGNGIKQAVLGGTFSVLGGGKFANGAITAAYGYLFNELMHKGRAGEAVARLRASSSTAREIIEGMEASKDLYIIRDGSVSGDHGGGVTRLAPRAGGGYIIDMVVNPDARVTFTDLQGNPFTVSLDRIVAHELGHGKTFLEGNPVGFRYNYNQAIEFENRIMREVDPKAPFRHPTRGHSRFLF